MIHVSPGFRMLPIYEPAVIRVMQIQVRHGKRKHYEFFRLMPWFQNSIAWNGKMFKANKATLGTFRRARCSRWTTEMYSRGFISTRTCAPVRGRTAPNSRPSPSNSRWKTWDITSRPKQNQADSNTHYCIYSRTQYFCSSRFMVTWAVYSSSTIFASFPHYHFWHIFPILAEQEQAKRACYGSARA